MPIPNHRRQLSLSISLNLMSVANYPAAKAILESGNKEWIQRESLKPDNAFGPNIPAGGKSSSNGKEHLGTFTGGYSKNCRRKMC